MLGETVTRHRLSLVTQIIRLLLTMIPQQRGRILHEQLVSYRTAPDKAGPTVDWETLDALPKNVALP